ncbi:MAG: methyl-accepting chemotaxis protein [Treponemataceae bacterium]|nr:methyl-accepting chemotaxis protein [Treponemataceae bacterium]
MILNRFIRCAPDVPKPPATIFFLNFLIFVAPAIGGIIQVLICNYLGSPAAVLAYFTKPVSLLYIFVSVAMPVFYYIFFMNQICGYEGSEDTLKLANRAYKNYTRLSIVPIIILNITFPELMAKANGFDMFHTTSISIYCNTLGSMFLFSLFFYICYLQVLEEYISFVPLRPEFCGMTLNVRTAIVSGFTLTGSMLDFMGLFITIPAGVSVVQRLLLPGVPFALAGVVIGIFDLMVMTSGITRRLNDITRMAEAIGEGDYTGKRLKIRSRDAFGLLANAMNDFSDTTRGLIGGIQKSGEVSKEVAQTLASNTSEMSKRVNKVTDSIGLVKTEMLNQSAGVEQAQSTVNNIVKNLSNLNDNVESQATSVTQASSAIEEMVANIQSVTNILERNGEAVVDLDEEASTGQQKVELAATISEKIHEESEGMQEASAIIQHIAEQTNMLAMNAAIEAAHAGDAGKGFAVVADEIRKLAEESNEQSRDISTRLALLGDSINEISESTQAVQEQFSRIFDLTQKIKQQEQVVMNAMQEQSAGSSQVLQAMKSINTITVSVKDGSEQMMRGSKEVSLEMDKLASVTRDITEAMNSMNEDTVHMTEKLGEVTTVVGKNEEAANDLAKQVKRFKL